jgi:diguanylate cyclase (GGDEF)-like protein
MTWRYDTTPTPTPRASRKSPKIVIVGTFTKPACFYHTRGFTQQGRSRVTMQVRSRRQKWLLIAAITTTAIFASELGILGVWLTLGEGAFGVANVILIGAIIPLIIALPASYVLASTAWELSRTHTERQVLADMDPLTRLINRRHFFDQASSCLAHCRDTDQPAVLIVIDADHFKDLNDTYGHSVGDEALITIAEILRDNFRDDDLIARVGGEEFAVLMPGMNQEQAYPLAERIVKKVGNRPLSTPRAIIEFSVSCGIADTGTIDEIEALYKAADDAMYVAKREGRNRVAPLAA